MREWQRGREISKQSGKSFWKQWMFTRLINGWLWNHLVSSNSAEVKLQHSLLYSLKPCCLDPKLTIASAENHRLYNTSGSSWKTQTHFKCTYKKISNQHCPLPLVLNSYVSIVLIIFGALFSCYWYQYKSKEKCSSTNVIGKNWL